MIFLWLAMRFSFISWLLSIKNNYKIQNTFLLLSQIGCFYKKYFFTAINKWFYFCLLPTPSFLGLIYTVCPRKTRPVWTPIVQWRNIIFFNIFCPNTHQILKFHFYQFFCFFLLKNVVKNCHTNHA